MQCLSLAYYLFSEEGANELRSLAKTLGINENTTYLL